jgi:hypothetical protein
MQPSAFPRLSKVQTLLLLHRVSPSRALSMVTRSCRTHHHVDVGAPSAQRIKRTGARVECMLVVRPHALCETTRDGNVISEYRCDINGFYAFPDEAIMSCSLFPSLALPCRPASSAQSCFPSNLSAHLCDVSPFDLFFFLGGEVGGLRCWTPLPLRGVTSRLTLPLSLLKVLASAGHSGGHGRCIRCHPVRRPSFVCVCVCHPVRRPSFWGKLSPPPPSPTEQDPCSIQLPTREG